MSKDVTRPRAIETLHGPLALPVFLPDATRGLVRGLDAADLRACGVEALAVSTFHLLNHPGATVLASLGGIGRMMGWDRPVLSDSGGFQIYSLLRADARMGGVSGRGFQYRF